MPRKRANRQISKCKYRIAALKIRRKKETLCKKLQQSKSHLTSNPRISSKLNNTPDSQTKHQVTAVGLKSMSAKIRKKLLLYNSLPIELNAAVDTNKKDLKSLRQPLSRKSVKKYWCTRAASTEINLERRKLAHIITKSIVINRRDRANFDSVQRLNLHRRSYLSWREVIILE